VNSGAIPIENFKAIPYLKFEHLGGGRTVKLMPLRIVADRQHSIASEFFPIFQTLTV
jgi:hypothetical protein